MKKFYKFLCLVYSQAITFWENNFLSKAPVNNNYGINLNGFELIHKKSNSDIINNENEISINKYTIKKIVDKKTLFEFINHIFFIEKLSKNITDRTGFNYSIDFFINYQTSNVTQSDIGGDWYANKWHIDKPYSKNTLKVIIPLNDMTSGNYGGIQILNILQSKNINEIKRTDNFNNFFEMRQNQDKLLIFYPQLCYHRAGNPSKNFTRNQIMIQLNPSKKWSINTNIYKKQFNIEPKFPFFNYMFENRIYFDIN